MKKYLFLVVLATTISLPVFSQTLNLPKLVVKDESIKSSLQYVTQYISAKPQGMRFPISKILFIKTDLGLEYEVTGIDNSWNNLFRYNEASYGYTVVDNRLFLVMGLKNEDIDLRAIFVRDSETKQFNKTAKPGVGVNKNPKWSFEYKNNLSIKLKEQDLDILDR